MVIRPGESPVREQRANAQVANPGGPTRYSKTQIAVIDGRRVRVETPRHQNERLASVLARWEGKQ